MKPSSRFPYGYGRIEDLAGVAVVLTIFASAAVAAYESMRTSVEEEAAAITWEIARFEPSIIASS
jgi:divalent metal cation (Fe/Co/Zn/Cd) transporter